MNDKDWKAWVSYEETIPHREGYTYIAREAWQAACEYKQKEINNLINGAAKDNEVINGLQAENKKLREALEEIKDYGYAQNYGDGKAIYEIAEKALEDK